MRNPSKVQWPMWAGAMVALGLVVTIAATYYDVFAT
jgi:hypothetical protein